MTPNQAGSTSVPGRDSRGPRLAAALAGALAAGAAIATGELAAGLIPGAPSLIIAVGTLVIDLQPPGAKDLVVGLFGTNDKLALGVLIVVAALLVAAGLGNVAWRRWRTGAAGFGAFGAVALFAALREPLVSPAWAIATAVGATALGLAILRLLLEASGSPWAGAALASGSDGVPATPSMPEWDRRRFLVRGTAVALGSVGVGALGHLLLDARVGGPGSAAAAAPSLPPPMSPAPDLPAGAALDVPGITPLVVPNDRFYRIDTSLLVPRVDVSTWQVTVKGLVDRPVTLRYQDLLAMPIFEQYVTIACVSNVVGGDLVGNALWSGVHLRDVLAMAGVRAGATQVVGRSVDGFTVGFPTAWAMDPGRDPMIALGMNGTPLPTEHGYPARLIVPGLFGYVSATKWLAEIELTTLEAFDAYWVPLGWAKEAPILTQSRIDVPRDGARVAAGVVAIAGVAWAPDRGVSAVEVRIDGGAWQPTTLSAAVARAAWVQWQVPWDAAAGDHRIEVRATDGTGAVQAADVTPPAPDGARGHHAITVAVG